MTDDLKRAMEALAHERELHRSEYDGASGTLYLSTYDADAILSAWRKLGERQDESCVERRAEEDLGNAVGDVMLEALREREQAIEQARADEREACRLIAKMGHEEQCDCLVCHDVAAAIRARGAR